jgi:23S rRNA (cytosine1962-C5)-methyltransferase
VAHVNFIAVLPCILFEDEHLLVVDKPAGMNTHSPSPFAGEGIYEWLRCREVRWGKLAIIHRLDKETSGVLLFSKTPRANRSLTEQFARRLVHKKYMLLTDRASEAKEFTVTSSLVRVGEKYLSRPEKAGAEIAETKFWRIDPSRDTTIPLAVPADALGAGAWLAEPLTGRTHQIRVHAAERGLPILGDQLYGGTAAARVFLHAAELRLKHPTTDKEISFRAPPDFAADSRIALREKLIEPDLTNACRLIHGASDGWPGGYLDRLGDFMIFQSEASVDSRQHDQLTRLAAKYIARGTYHKFLRRQFRGVATSEMASRLFIGQPASPSFVIRENGLQYELSFNEGYSTGLFLDQRENRRRLLTRLVAPGFTLYSERKAGSPPQSLLNTFSYTCAFSVCAAKVGMQTTSLDLSKKYLEWGKRNFALNQIPIEGHHFICGDVFEELRRFGKRGLLFDVLILDPPTFSQSKISGSFKVEKDYGKLLRLALPLLQDGGVLFASTNAAVWRAEEFLQEMKSALHKSSRQILQLHFVPQPPDFPISRAEPGYLKTVWIRIGKPAQSH